MTTTPRHVTGLRVAPRLLQPQAHLDAGRYTLIVPGPLPPSPNLRLHPLARYRRNKSSVDTIIRLCQCCHARPFARARVTITLVRRVGGARDQDNLVASIKAQLDALKGLLITDDDPEHLDLIVTQERLDTGPYLQLVVEAWR